jgi:TolB protein
VNRSNRLPPWPRRRFIFSAAAVCAAPAAAQFRVEITGIGGNQIPVAVATFRDEDKSPAAVAAIVRADLQRSGLFRIVELPGTFDERSRITADEWRGRGADALAVGSVSRLADGRYDVRYKL